MCGIGGQSGSVDETMLQRLRVCLEHRGPDGSGTWVAADARSALVHTRLAILDLSEAAAQPMVSRSGRTVIAFNGEIYNHAELRTRYLSDVAFSSSGDTATLVELLDRHGLACLRWLRGIFAIAVVDRDTGEMHLARDLHGVKPLYYANGDDRVIFASELKAILTDGTVKRTISERSAMRSVAYLWTPSPETILDGCRKVEPGQIVTIDDGRVVRTQSFSSDAFEKGVAIDRRDELELEIGEQFRAAVRRQGLSDVPIGAFFSGGLDSSAIAVEAARSPQFSAALTADTGAMASEGFARDLPYAQAIAEQRGMHHIVVPGTKLDGASFARFVWLADEIHADPAVLLANDIANAARTHGLKVLFSGAGGDDFFTGYRRHQVARIAGAVTHIPAAARDWISRPFASLSPTRPLARRAAKLARALPGTLDERLTSLFLWIESDALAAVFGAYESDVETVVLDPLLAVLEEHADRSALERVLELDQRFFLADHNLDYIDKATMASGVEVRVPFLDEELTGLAGANTDRLMKGLTAKAALRTALSRIAPEASQPRPKTGFGSPIRVAFEEDLGPVLDDVLSPTSIAARGLFDSDAVERLRGSSREGRTDAAYPMLAMASIEGWCRTFLDRADADRPLDTTW